MDGSKDSNKWQSDDSSLGGTTEQSRRNRVESRRATFEPASARAGSENSSRNPRGARNGGRRVRRAVKNVFESPEFYVTAGFIFHVACSDFQ